MRCVNEESVMNAMDRHKHRAMRKQKIEKQLPLLDRIYEMGKSSDVLLDSGGCVDVALSML